MNSSKLVALMVEVANEKFGTDFFNRRKLMDATEAAVRKKGLWTPED